MKVRYEDIDKFARKCFERASTCAEAIRFALESHQYEKRADGQITASYQIGNAPRFVDLKTSNGVGGWAVVLSVDLRGSSKRAVKIGPEKTYLTMHTYIPTMVELVARAGGQVGSLRGDGLFAVFGFTEFTDETKEVPKSVMNKAVQSATRCGKAMIETTDEILNPILQENKILAQLVVGVGICHGDVVVTQIGIGDAFERTLYGPPVNHACKASSVGHNEMILTNKAEEIYPSSDGGKVKFKPYHVHKDIGGQLMQYPPGYVVLQRDDNLISTRRPK